MPYTVKKLGFILLPIVAVTLMAWHESPPEYTDDGRLIVTYWEKWTDFEGRAIQDAVDEFNRTIGRQKDIEVQLLQQGDIEEKVKLAASGGNPPDLVGLYSFNVNVYASQHVLMPLDEWLEEAGISSDRYIDSYWRLNTHDGRTWCITSAPATLALFYNKTHFREAGLDPEKPPTTLEELTEIGHKLTRIDAEGNITRMGFMPAEPGWWKYAWGWWFGGRLWDGTDTITANSPENVAALKWIEREYVERYNTLPDADGTPRSGRLSAFKNSFGPFDSPNNAFFTGKVSMVLQGVWFPNFIDKNASDELKANYGVAPFPSITGGPENLTIAESDVIGIPTGARHPREAFEFVKFMASRRGVEILCRGQGKHSPHLNPSPGFFQDHPNPHVRLFHRLALSPNARRTPAIGVWKEYQQSMGVAFDRIWNPDASEPTTVEAELGEVQRHIQQRLDRDLLGRRIRQQALDRTREGATP